MMAVDTIKRHVCICKKDDSTDNLVRMLKAFLPNEREDSKYIFLPTDIYSLTKPYARLYKHISIHILGETKFAVLNILSCFTVDAPHHSSGRSVPE